MAAIRGSGSRRVQAYQSRKYAILASGEVQRNPCPYLHTNCRDNNNKNALKKQNANFSSNQLFSKKYVREPSTHVNSNQPCPDKGRDLRTLISSIKQCSAKKIPCDENPNAPAMNSQTGADLILSGTFGKIHSLKVGNDMLFAGTQDGTILAWKYNDSSKSFELAASLRGHNLAVVSLFVGAGKMLYSASMDHTIRVWFRNESSGNLEAIYTHYMDHGLRLLHGVHDGDGRAVLMCSCNDKTMRLYDCLRLRREARIFSVEEIQPWISWIEVCSSFGDGALARSSMEVVQ
ncbi:hypothetical protein Sjap_021993 [Stephania japonica]|uniref:Uncharacterized protein n=1 Tax=Stephania japonica TaxID=461633 RepID=A0AAP0HU02_9MAGN